MSTSELRQRVALNHVPETKNPPTATSDTNGYPPRRNEELAHPSGKAKYGRFRALIRAFTFSLYFTAGCLVYAFHPGRRAFLAKSRIF
jgi:lysocardiolipin and lysophospholipid acyltransferase